VNSCISRQSRERTAGTEARCLMRELLSLFLRGKWCFPRLELFSNIQNYVLAVWTCYSCRGVLPEACWTCPCPYEKCLGTTVCVLLFSKSPLSSLYLKQDLTCRDSVASLDGPLTSAGPFRGVVEMLWFFRLPEAGVLVHKKQNGNW